MKFSVLKLDCGARVGIGVTLTEEEQQELGVAYRRFAVTVPQMDRFAAYDADRRYGKQKNKRAAVV